MTGTLKIEWTTIDSMLQSMVDVGLQAGDLDDYFQEHVVNTEGLDYPTCALKPIGDQLPKVGIAVSRTRFYYQKRWVEVIEAIAQSAAEIDRTDHEINIAFDKYVGELDSMPSTAISVKAFEPRDLELLAPAEGEPQLKHNSVWKQTSEGYDATRDGINEAVDFINGLGVPGVDLPRLSEKSLEDYIVYPLAGNYQLLGANADACTKIDTAFTGWALNFTRLSGQVPLAITGQTSGKLMLHLNLYALVMKTVGEAIGHGNEVFGAIAKMSEKIAVAVENALVKMATKLTKLLAKLSSKLSLFGWIVFAKELADKGFEAVTEIYDDIMECKDIINACFGLVEEIEAWAQTMSDSLAAMREIRDMVDQLPTINSDGGIGSMPPINLPAVEKHLGEITVEVKPDGDKEKSLDDRLDELEGQTEEEEEDDSDDSDDSEDSDGPMMMAPGPLDPLGLLPGTGTGTIVL